VDRTYFAPRCCASRRRYPSAQCLQSIVHVLAPALLGQSQLLSERPRCIAESLGCPKSGAAGRSLPPDQGSAPSLVVGHHCARGRVEAPLHTISAFNVLHGQRAHVASRVAGRAMMVIGRSRIKRLSPRVNIDSSKVVPVSSAIGARDADDLRPAVLAELIVPKFECVVPGRRMT
jgi:hypothetical protein